MTFDFNRQNAYEIDQQRRDEIARAVARQRQADSLHNQAERPSFIQTITRMMTDIINSTLTRQPAPARRAQPYRARMVR